MRVPFHPEFPQDIRKFGRDYQAISDGLAARFRREIDEALEAIKLSPQSVGHFLQGLLPKSCDSLERSGASLRARRMGAAIDPNR